MTRPQLASWPDGRAVAVVFNVAYEGWAAGRAPALGPMGNPLPAGLPDTQALSWGRYAQRRGIQRLMQTLDDAGVRATVMVSGSLAEDAPETVAALHEAGHDLCAHSYSQDVLPVSLDPEAERADIVRCVELLRRVTGAAPRGWMSPRGTPSLVTGDLLAELGFDWHGDCFDDDVPVVEHHPAGDLIAIPFTMEVNDLPVNLRHGNPPEALLEVFRGTLRALKERERGPIHLDVTVHAHVFGRPLGAAIYAQMLAEATADPAIWVPTRSDIADWARTALTP